MNQHWVANLGRGLAAAGILIAVAAGPPALAQGWAPGPTLPIAATRFDAEYHNGRIYFLGGRDADDATFGNILALDLATATFANTGAEVPVPVSNYSIAPLQDQTGLGFYLFGGRDELARVITDVQVYYPDENQAFRVASDPYPGTTDQFGCVTLPAMGVAVAGNKGYVIGGLSFSSTGCTNDFSTETWIFDPSAAFGARWTEGPALNVGRGYITTAVAGDKLYAIGGDILDAAGNLIPQTTVEVLDLANPVAWDDAGAADLPVPCDESQAFGFPSGTLAGKVVLAGCGQWPDGVPATLVFDGTQWLVGPQLVEGRRNHAGAVIPTPGGPRIIVFGGYGEDQLYDFATNTSEHLGLPAASLPARGLKPPLRADRAGVPTH